MSQIFYVKRLEFVWNEAKQIKQKTQIKKKKNLRHKSDQDIQTVK